MPCTYDPIASVVAAQFDGLDAALQREADSQSLCYSSGDYLAGINGILKKAHPTFQGWEK